MYYILSKGDFKFSAPFTNCKGHKGRHKPLRPPENSNRPNFNYIYAIFNTYQIRMISIISAPFVNCKGAQRGAEDPHENSDTSNFDEI